MADPKETIYAADPHTRAKHRILEGYLKRFFTILRRQGANMRSSQRLLYVDGFAGAGEYEGKVPGSPLVAISAALAATGGDVPIHIRLIELRKDRVEHLRRLTDRKSLGEHSHGIFVHPPLQGDCAEEIPKLERF